MTTRQHFLDASVVHYEWNNAIPARLEIDPGDTVVFETRDASDEFYTLRSTHEDVMQRVFKGHPLTGPVRIRGARPGDVLAVEIIEVAPRAAFGWTNVRPGRGLLPESEFNRPFLQLWDVSDGRFARGMRDIAVPLAPFPGVMGVALDDVGSHNTAPPRKNGGNMDIKQLTAGTTVFLPVWVDGALFSVGDAHGAQGDGEVCITAVEMNARITLRFELQPGRNLTRARPGPLPVRAPGRAPHDRSPRTQPRPVARRSLHSLQCRRRSQGERDRRCAELDRLGVSAGDGVWREVGRCEFI